MPRKAVKPREKRGLPPADYKYGSVVVSRFINKMNFAGKKTVAEGIVYGAIDILKDKTSEEPLKVFLQALENARPIVETKARRIGGATYQVPQEVPQARSESIGMRWVILYAKERKGMSMAQKLAEELLAAYKKEGSAVKKREDTHKMADANKAFAHYRW